MSNPIQAAKNKRRVFRRQSWFLRRAMNRDLVNAGMLAFELPALRKKP